MTIDINPDLPQNYRRPGIFTSVRFTDAGAVAPGKRCLMLGYKLPAGTASLNTPILPVNLADAIAKFGAGSMLARMYAAARTQGKYGAEIWCLPLPTPSGAAATHLIQFLAAPNSDGTVGTNTTTQTVVTCSIYVGERGGSFSIQMGSTFAQAATLGKAMLDGVSDLGVTVSISGDTLTLVDRSIGEHGTDMPVRVSFSNVTAKIAASPGSLLFASGPATGAGSATLQANALSAQATIGAGSTDAQSATAMANKINSAGYCVSAALHSPTDGSVVLYYKQDRVAHQLSVSVNGITPQTLTATVGTAGSGTPSISAALATLTADSQAYKAWAIPFKDSANWSALAAHIEAMSLSPVEKGQTAHGAISVPLAVYGVAPLSAATTPKLSSSPRYCLDLVPGATVPAYEIAGRTAAMVAAADYAGQNFNGYQLLSSDTAPLGVPDRADRLIADDIEQALETYQLTPIVVDEDGLNAVERSTTTYKSLGTQDRKLEKWSCVLQLDFMRASLRYQLGKLFGGKSIKRYSAPRTSNAVEPANVKAAVYRIILGLDDLDLFDGARGARDAIMAGVYVTPTRVDVAMPLIPLSDLDQISVAGSAE